MMRLPDAAMIRASFRTMDRENQVTIRENLVE
jgi:hypothetical protein